MIRCKCLTVSFHFPRKLFLNQLILFIPFYSCIHVHCLIIVIRIWKCHLYRSTKYQTALLSAIRRLIHSILPCLLVDNSALMDVNVVLYVITVAVAEVLSIVRWWYSYAGETLSARLACKSVGTPEVCVCFIVVLIYLYLALFQLLLSFNNNNKFLTLLNKWPN